MCIRSMYVVCYLAGIGRDHGQIVSSGGQRLGHRQHWRLVAVRRKHEYSQDVCSVHFGRVAAYRCQQQENLKTKLVLEILSATVPNSGPNSSLHR